MKRRLCLTILLAALLVLLPARVHALTEDELVRRQEDAADTASVAEAVPESAADALEELGIDPAHPAEGMKKFTISALFDVVKDGLLGAVSAPLRSLGAILGAVLIASVFADEKRRVLRSVCTAGAGIAVIAPIASLAASAAATLTECSVFMTASLPVFATLTVSGGMPVSSGFMNAAMLGLSNALSAIGGKVLLPVACASLALSAVGAFAPELKTEKLASSVRNFTLWGVGAALTLYLTFIGIQSGITSSLDGLTHKALKVTVSGALPVVGGIISDASETVFGAAELIRGGMGGLALVVIAVAFAKPLFTALVWAAALRLAEFAAASFGSDDVAALTGAARKTVTATAALFAAAAVAITVSVAILVRLKV